MSGSERRSLFIRFRDWAMMHAKMPTPTQTPEQRKRALDRDND